MHIVLVGMSHRTAPVEVRERWTLDRSGLRAALATLKDARQVTEVVVLTTCNRVEVIAAGPDPEALRIFLEEYLCRAGRGGEVELSTHLYRHLDVEAARHVFAVASGLDSMVPGEGQVLTQTREAYQEAVEAGTAGRLLNGLFQRAFATAKRVRSETQIGRGRLSVSSVAVDLLKGVFDDFSDKTALVIGAGETAKLTLVHLAELHVGRVLLANRTPQAARTLSQRFNGSIVPFEELSEHLVQADIVISSTSSRECVVTAEMVRRHLSTRRGRPLVIVDIAVPRDVEPETGNLPGVFLYDIDDLETVVRANLDRRQQSVSQAAELLEDGVQEFYEWLLSLELGSLVQRFRKSLHSESQAELQRLDRRLGHLSPAERLEVQESVRRIVNKILHKPMEVLRREAMRGDSECADALRKLFDLPEDGGRNQNG